EVERNTAIRRVQMAFKRGARAECDNGHALCGTQLYDADHFLRAMRKGDGLRRLILDPGQRVTMLLAEGGRLAKAVSEPAFKIFEKRATVFGARIGRWRDVIDGHRLLLLSRIPECRAKRQQSTWTTAKPRHRRY